MDAIEKKALEDSIRRAEEAEERIASKDAELTALRKEVALNLESANSMKAAWNAACEDISKLQTLLDALESAFANWQSSGTREDVRKWDEKVRELFKTRHVPGITNIADAKRVAWELFNESMKKARLDEVREIPYRNEAEGNPYYCDRCKVIHDRPSKACDEFVPGEYTEQQGLRLMELSHELWKIAAPTGSLSSLWNVIFDVEMFLKKGRPILKRTAEEWIAWCEELVRESRQKGA